MKWVRMLAYISGLVDEELLLRNEYLTAENRTLRAQLKGRLRLSDAKRATLGEIGHRLGRTAVADVANAALPDTILGWYRRLVARKFNGSKTCRGVGRPRVTSELEQLIVKMVRENPGWGYDRIVGALANLGHEISDQTVGNILKRHSVPTAPERKHTTNWADFIRAHMAVLTGTDFFSLEVLTLRGLVTYYVLFFIHLESRKVEIAGITRHPDARSQTTIPSNPQTDVFSLRPLMYFLGGLDARGRKQYRYHSRWRSVRDENKYEHLLEFARALPAIRRLVNHDLARTGLPREKVLAAVVRLMEKTLARVGNTEYLRENKSFGLTTLKNRHITIKKDKIDLDFLAKSHVQYHRAVSDGKLARILKNCRDLPGSELFQYVDENGTRHSIDSSDVNEYLRKISGREISAKDFRTWAGTNSRHTRVLCSERRKTIEE
jgi:putative transposase